MDHKYSFELHRRGTDGYTWPDPRQTDAVLAPTVSEARQRAECPEGFWLGNGTHHRFECCRQSVTIHGKSQQKGS